MSDIQTAGDNPRPLAIRQNGVWRRMASRLFYKIVALARVSDTPNAGDYALLVSRNEWQEQEIRRLKAEAEIADASAAAARTQVDILATALDLIQKKLNNEARMEAARESQLS